MTIPFTWCREEITAQQYEQIVFTFPHSKKFFTDYGECEIWWFISPIYNHHIEGLAAVYNGEVVGKLDLTAGVP